MIRDESQGKYYPRLTAALLTPMGRGAVATIRVMAEMTIPFGNQDPAKIDQAQISDESPFSLLDSLFRPANGVDLNHQPLRRITFGHWGRSDIEQIVVSRLTTDTLEIHCHGGAAAARRILNDLEAHHCKIVDWRTQVATTADNVEAECQDVLSRTTTWRTTEIVMGQMNGRLRDAFRQLNHTSTLGKAAILAHLDKLLAWADFGLHLSMPWNVVITGRPNVGKSSVINALLGYQRAIVFDEPGTTRDVVTGETALEGWPIIFSDTAGMRERADELEAEGMARARQRLRTADLRLVVIDLGQQPNEGDFKLFAEWPDAIVLANKSDLSDQWIDQLPSGSLKVSAVTGEGLIEVQHAIVKRLIPMPPDDATPIPMTARQVGELWAARRAVSQEDRQAAIDRLLSEGFPRRDEFERGGCRP